MTTQVWTSPASRQTSWISKLLDALRAHHERGRAVNELAALSDERLRDIGIERPDIARRIEAEMAKINLKRLGRIGLC